MNNEHQKSAYSRFSPLAEIEPFFFRYGYLFALNRCYVVHMTRGEHIVMGLHDFDCRWCPPWGRPPKAEIAWKKSIMRQSLLSKMAPVHSTFVATPSKTVAPATEVDTNFDIFILDDKCVLMTLQEMHMSRNLLTKAYSTSCSWNVQRMHSMRKMKERIGSFSCFFWTLCGKQFSFPPMRN